MISKRWAGLGNRYHLLIVFIVNRSVLARNATQVAQALRSSVKLDDLVGNDKHLSDLELELENVSRRKANSSISCGCFSSIVA